MVEPAPLEVTAVVVEGRRARDPAAELQAQLEEAKAAAMAAADRMQSLLLQMAVMETAAAERRLAELNVRAELNRQQLACGAQQAATSSTSCSAPAAVAAALGGGAGGAAFVEPTQPAKADALTAETRPDANDAGAHHDDRCALHRWRRRLGRGARQWDGSLATAATHRFGEAAHGLGQHRRLGPWLWRQCAA